MASLKIINYPQTKERNRTSRRYWVSLQTDPQACQSVPPGVVVIVAGGCRLPQQNNSKTEAFCQSHRYNIYSLFLTAAINKVLFC